MNLTKLQIEAIRIAMVTVMNGPSDGAKYREALRSLLPPPPEHTWAVYWRYNGFKNGPSCWNSEPRKYKSEKAAQMAHRDLTKAYEPYISQDGARIEYFVVPLDQSPYEAALERLRD